MKMSDQEYIFASLNTQKEEESVFKSYDPFNKDWNIIKDLSGLDSNFRRRTTRKMDKFTPSTQYLDAANATATGQGAGSKAINPGTVYRNGYGLFDVITPPYNLYELSNFYDTSFANHAAIDAKVSNIVGLGYKFETTDRTKLMLESKDDQEAVKRAIRRMDRAKIELRDWLEELNDDDSFQKTMEKVVTDLQATGNGYIEIGRTVTGEIGYLGHVPSTTVRVRRLKDGFIQIIGNKVVYFRNFGAKNPNPVTDDPRPNELIHFKEYSPLNTYYGVPDIIAALPSLIGDQFASQYNIDYFKNKAVPRYIVTLKGAKLSADAEDKMFRFLQGGLKSQSHRTLYIPLPGDNDNNKVEFKMEAVENGIQEASFKEYHKQNRDDILVAHQVPISKLGGSDSSAIAAALAQDRTFKEQVCRPAQKHLEKMVNKIIKEKTDIFELKFNELTLTDEITQSQILERYVKAQILLPNEARNEIGKSNIPSGDSPLVLNPRQAADAIANTSRNRARDTERINNQADGPATTSGRNPQGEGRSST